MPNSAQGLLLRALSSGITPSGTQGPYGILSIEPGSAARKESTLPTLISFWPLDLKLFHYKCEVCLFY